MPFYLMTTKNYLAVPIIPTCLVTRNGVFCVMVDFCSHATSFLNKFVDVTSGHFLSFRGKCDIQHVFDGWQMAQEARGTSKQEASSTKLPLLGSDILARSFHDVFFV